MKSFWLLVATSVAFSAVPSEALSRTRDGNEDSRNHLRAASENSSATSTRTGISRRQGRTFSPVQILNLPHPSCRYDSRRNGTCMQGTECVLAGGKFKVDSLCNPARGAYVATCCLLEQTCGGVIRKNNTYFVNPDFPEDTTEPQTCDVSVAVGLASLKACYLRLDFSNFTIHDPLNGTCEVDQFRAVQFDNLPKLCGYNNQSHMYIYVKDLSLHQNVTLRFNLGEWQGARHWMINVAVIDCGRDWTPPSRSCLQYHFGPKGSIRSFNYHELRPERSALLSNLGYTICIRQEPTKCFTRWTSNFFSLSASNKTTAIGDACQKSYVAISQGFNYLKQDSTYDRYCGEVFGSESNSTNSSAVYSAAIPFNVVIRHSGDSKSLGKGFYLNYTQIQCGRMRSHGGVLSWFASFLPSFVTGSPQLTYGKSVQLVEEKKKAGGPEMANATTGKSINRCTYFH